VYAAQSVTAHGWIDSCGVAQPPTFTRAVATPASIHDGTICEEGLNCQAATYDSDRRLGDYITTSITADGRLVIAYGRTSGDPSGAISHPGFVRQSGGVDFVS